MPEIPYQDDQVTEILIAGAPDWIPVVQGSMRTIDVGFNAGETRPGITVKDRMDGSEVFFFAERLLAVKYRFEDSAPTPTADGRLLP